MTSRNYTDQILRLIDSEVAELRVAGKPLTRLFFENPDLEMRIKSSIYSISGLFKWPVPSDESFRQYYVTGINEYRANNATDIVASLSLQKSYEPSWLTEERIKETNWHYSDRYFRYLENNGRSEKIITETKRSSLEILKKIGDPKSDKAFFTKGLVVGSVQSGKTGNFNAVINGAVDLDYTLIIVLSGIMEDLRVQTQLRIEDDVVGYGVIDTERGNIGFKGVGNIMKFGELGDNTIKQILIPTSPKTDFNKNVKAAEFPINYKNILVCKKNSSVLSNLILWLGDCLAENQEKHDIPFLIIDDEADNASLNNMGHKGREYATKINGHIRALLGMFTRKTYLGYTATPFANVLQDRNEAPENKWPINTKVNGQTVIREFEMVDNLSPEDFIELLFPPSIYVGAKHFFETRMDEIKKIEPLVAPAVTDHNQAFPSRLFKDSGLPALQGDKDTRASKREDPYPEFIPVSLKEAIMCFIISTAVRLSRKSEMLHSKQYQPHNTMLIHISRFTKWQNTAKDLVKEFVDGVTIRLNTELADSPGSIYSEFERIWFRYYADVIKNIKSYLPEDYEDEFLTVKEFKDDIKPLLVAAANGIQVLAINSDTDDELNYSKKTDKKYIAIGGNRLSRGFTLEGLTINYFIRNTDFADTLLQMGRWFGYRPGYLDCCKLFTTQQNIHKFDTVSVAIEELEDVFREINSKKGKPSDFEIRVRNNPKVIKLTRSSILQNAEEVKVNFTLGIEQSTKFIIDKARIENSWYDLRNLIKTTTWEAKDDKDTFVYQTNSEGLFRFLDIRNSFFDFDISGVKEYILLCNEHGKLINWTIGIKRNKVSTTKIVLEKSVSGLPDDVNLTVRRGPLKDSNAWFDLIDRDIFKVSGKSAQIVTTGADFSLTLTADQIEKVKSNFKKRKIKDFIDSGDSPEIAGNRAEKLTTIPDKDFRLQMKETDGILMIYLVDPERIFESKEGEVDEGLLKKGKKVGLNPKTPLYGYALGFPEISGNIGGDYMRFKEPEDDPDELQDEFIESLIED